MFGRKKGENTHTHTHTPQARIWTRGRGEIMFGNFVQQVVSVSQKRFQFVTEKLTKLKETQMIQPSVAARVLAISQEHMLYVVFCFVLFLLPFLKCSRLWWFLGCGDFKFVLVWVQQTQSTVWLARCGQLWPVHDQRTCISQLLKKQPTRSKSLCGFVWFCDLVILNQILKNFGSKGPCHVSGKLDLTSRHRWKSCCCFYWGAHFELWLIFWVGKSFQQFENKRYNWKKMAELFLIINNTLISIWWCAVHVIDVNDAGFQFGWRVEGSKLAENWPTMNIQSVRVFGFRHVFPCLTRIKMVRFHGKKSKMWWRSLVKNWLMKKSKWNSETSQSEFCWGFASCFPVFLVCGWMRRCVKLTQHFIVSYHWLCQSCVRGLKCLAKKRRPLVCCCCRL